jgi:hypothetical protein|uniref:Uncharacterized protein n=1 Tax=Sipha flava TaxID=143950 RepID=A0A2S2PY41_9HEMI
MVTQQTIAIIFHIVSSVGATTPQALGTKDKDSPAKCALCTSNYRGCPSFKALLKRSKSFHSKPQNPNTVLSSHQPKIPPPHLPKVSFATVADSNTIPLPNSHTSDKSLAKFISVLSSLINPLITLLTAILNEQFIPCPFSITSLAIL